jgi:GMP synthase (glutamine-hydrolysing)
LGPEIPLHFVTFKRFQAVVLTHVPFEDLGSLQPELERRRFAVETVHVPAASFPLPQAQHCDLLIVLGGPIGVCDTQDYPFLTAEIDCIRQRLAARRPILGICLGAQLMAAALGARVYPGASGPEIGWSPLQPPGAQSASSESPPPQLARTSSVPSWFAPLLAPDLSVFHWHGDTFDPPAGTRHLASSTLYPNQAFALENYGLALQFHPEVTAIGLERWYVGHTCELRQKAISIAQLRADANRHAAALARASTQFFKLWLDYIL